jgi:hypothetical protein
MVEETDEAGDRRKRRRPAAQRRARNPGSPPAARAEPRLGGGAAFARIDQWAAKAFAAKAGSAAG